MLGLIIAAVAINTVYLLVITLGWLTADMMSFKKYVSVAFGYVINIIALGMVLNEYLR